MKSILLTGMTGQVAHVMKKELDDKYEISGISITRMDDVLQTQPADWKTQLDTYRERVIDQVATACRGKDAIVHLGWNTRDENCGRGLDPLNVLQTDCVYRAAIAEKVPRIYMTSSVHAYDFEGDDFDPNVAIPITPDTRQDPFGTPPTSLYGVSKRWMEIAGQFYTPQLEDGHAILAVRLGGVQRDPARPSPEWARVWGSHRDCAGLLEAFVECENPPPFWIAYGVSDNRGPDQEPLFDLTNPYGHQAQDNGCVEPVEEVSSA